MGTCAKYNKANIGKAFSFHILKEITLPGDASLYYIMGDADNCKFTLPKSAYAHYGFVPGQQITCHLDRINCNGQFFFEPLNPYYQAGKAYDFEFIDFQFITNYLGFKETIARVSDTFGKEQWIRHARSLTIDQNKVRAWVSFIKKGNLFLVPEAGYKNMLLPGKIFEFQVIKRSNSDRFGEVYILNDRQGNEHVLPTKYYASYKLEPKVWFQAQIQKFSSKGFFYIEPLHPWYLIGKSYPFTIIDIIKDTKDTTCFTLDCFENIVSFKTSGANLKIKDKVFCTISGFKKGKPQLDIDREAPL